MSTLNPHLIVKALLAGVFVCLLPLAIAAQDPPVPAPASAEEAVDSASNQCVLCHVTLKGEDHAVLEANFQKWLDSSHSKQDVTCDKCHGGNPSAAVKDVAHIGVIDIQYAGKPMYYIELDKKCGGCHATEFKTFSSSKHFEYLKQGTGPSCIGCHNPKSGKVLAHGEIVNYCYDCHNTQDNPGSEFIPKQAELTLLLVDAAQMLVDWAEADIEMLKSQGKNVTGPMTRLSFAKREADLPQYWHQFNLTATQQHAINTIEQMKDVRAAMIKAPLKKETIPTPKPE